MSKHPQPATATLVRIQLDLPEPTISDYERVAQALGKSAESLIAERLQSCASHTATRGLYFGDAEREELEQLLGGGIFNLASDVLQAIRDRYTVVIGGERVKIDEPVYTAIKDRAAETGRVPREMIVEACQNGLNDSVYGAH